jgi:hypothetical protein
MPYTVPEGIIPEDLTAFSKILPYEQVFDPATIQNLAHQMLFPDVYRERAGALRGLGQNMALSGAYRTGRAATSNEDMMNQYMRKLGEQKLELGDTVDEWMNNWYTNELYGYSTSPSTYSRPDKLPTFEEYMAEQGLEAPSPNVSLTETGTYSGSDIGQAMRNIGLLSQAYKGTTAPAVPDGKMSDRKLGPVFSDSPTPSSLSGSIYTGLPTGPTTLRGF